MDVCHHKKRKPDLTTFNTLDEDQDKELKKGSEEVCPWSYYMENLFSNDDIYLYRGIVRFYSGNFQGSIDDYNSSKKTKKVNKMLDN